MRSRRTACRSACGLSMVKFLQSTGSHARQSNQPIRSQLSLNLCELTANRHVTTGHTMSNMKPSTSSYYMYRHHDLFGRFVLDTVERKYYILDFRSRPKLRWFLRDILQSICSLKRAIEIGRLQTQAKAKAQLLNDQQMRCRSGTSRSSNLEDLRPEII